VQQEEVEVGAQLPPSEEFVAVFVEQRAQAEKQQAEVQEQGVGVLVLFQ
jgi:hypothetical protein